MAKFEITLVKTYDVDPGSLWEDYRTLDWDEALDIDVENFEVDPSAYMDGSEVITARIIEE